MQFINKFCETPEDILEVFSEILNPTVNKFNHFHMNESASKIEFKRRRGLGSRKCLFINMKYLKNYILNFSIEELEAFYEIGGENFYLLINNFMKQYEVKA